MVIFCTLVSVYINNFVSGSLNSYLILPNPLNYLGTELSNNCFHLKSVILTVT